MTSLYEVLKRSKTAPQLAPDMFTALWAKSMVAGKINELSGQVPLSFKANGKPLLDYTISGNMEQSGTPTPDNPIMPQGTGERTGNLFNVSLTQGVWAGNAGESPHVSPSTKRICTSNIINLDSTKTYTFAPRQPDMYIVVKILDSNGNILSDSGWKTSVTFGNAYGIVATFRFANESEISPQDFMGAMLNEGSAALPYEPYGYKIPISSAGQTTPIYLGEVETTRQIKKLVLTGNEPFTKNDGQSTHYLYYANKGTIFPRSIGKTPVICNELPEKNDAPQTVIGINTNNTFGVVYFNFGAEVMNAQPSGNTVAGLKEYLAQQYAAGTPVCVWYVLAEPETGIVNEPLMRIGDYADTLSMEQAGVQIPTNNGSTTLDVLTTIKPSNVSIKYRV